MTPVERAVTALLYEVSATPTPGNVDRRRDHESLRFEQFQAGAVGALDGLRAAAGTASIGTAIETATRGMYDCAGENTQFGALLLLVPLVRAAATDALTPAGLGAITGSTTVDDTVALYRAFEEIPVGVAEPPTDLDDLDVRLGTEAIPAVRDRDLTLAEFMARSAERDDVAREWTADFPRTFDAAERILAASGPIGERLPSVHLGLLADRPDTHIRARHGPDVAQLVQERARSVDAGADSIEAFADELVADGINPGTTADLLAAGTFVALERGVETP